MYIDWSGREQEDQELDNMRRDRREQEQRRGSYWQTHDRDKYSYIDDAAEAAEQQRQGRVPTLRSVQGCYTVAPHEGNYYPCRWQEDENVTGWRWVMAIGYFEIQALCFPALADAWAWVYQQP